MVFWRLVGAAVVIAAVWAISEYIDVQTAVIALAGVVAISNVHIQERFDQIGKALEIQAKKLFPEAWED